MDSRAIILAFVKEIMSSSDVLSLSNQTGKQAWNLVLKKVLVEVDNSTVVEMVYANIIDVNAYASLLISIRDLLSRKWDIRALRHIFRENNMCADWMAHLGGSIPIGLQLFDDPSHELLILNV
ncbi:hypothetical protein GH714_031139 [Hevea brasiliensis]|uniref:RNase H type-1 domain-containing protein n=1 Tax=Hevea brasiliensis TaxID=3981 RepID=A0A6A6LNG3_HEVBR|nr:hypothetical protein GH714_031139 [Hevea brasiliensis]